MRNFPNIANSRTLHGLFEEQATKTPEAVAVICESKTWSYGALNESSNRLSIYLRESLGVQTGDRVGVVTGPSGAMIVALLAILKAGAAYVPIHRRHPWDTVSYMLENAGIGVVVLSSDAAATVASFDGELFVLDVELETLAPAGGNPGIAVNGRDLAYAIYTSGSTGRPKCVSVEHSAILNTILWRNAYYGIDARDVNLQIPSFAFDSSVLDIFCFLAAGGRLVIPSEELRLDSRFLKDLITAHSISRFMVTSSYYKTLAPELKGVSSLRSVTVAGESTSADLVSEHYNSLPGIPLINEYGPTENAVCSTACELAEGDVSVPIGRPIPNVEVLVLDENLRSTPAGVSGEIFLAGRGLARGYLNQPALTAERFLPSPIPGREGRMYRTGDWGRWRADGMLEFQGRMDHQVKIRGFRIELMEIENVLRRNAAVDAVAVLCKTDSSGNKYLAAYVASRSGIGAGELAGYARESLAYYMVPDVFTVMPELPLNLNGKVDTGHLRGLDDFKTTAGASKQPENALEQALASICGEVLRRPGLATDDDFFAAGANSLRVMEMIIMIRNELHIGIELLDVYTYPSIKELAARIHNQDDGASALSLALPMRG
jgi:amino acid adenylation domain-containing protein